MLQLLSGLPNRHVMSLRTGTAIASIEQPVINPDNLKIEGFYCVEHDDKEEKILLSQDIRDTVPGGFVVNDLDALSNPDELVRLQSLLDQDFLLRGMSVETVSGDKIGKVGDYAFETTTMYVQKIYVVPSLLKSLTGGSLSIDRSQIHETTQEKIIIHDLLETVTAPAASPISA